MTTTKSIMSMTGIAFALMFGGGVYLLANLNHFAKDYAEKIASETLGVAVTIGDLDVDLKSRNARVKNLNVKNVQGYPSDYLLKVSQIDVVLGDLSKALVRFEQIDVSGVQIWMDVKPEGSNIQAVQNRVNASKKASSDENVKVIIDRLSLRAMTLNTGVTAVGEVRTFDPVSMPDLSLRDIGKRENGVLARDAIAQVWQSLSRKIIAEAPQKALIEDVKNKAVNKVRGFLGGAFGN